MKEHHYSLTINWTGNKGTGTDNYRSYDRSYEVAGENKVVLEGSSDPSFLGDKTKYNPEELLLASLSSCHLLWFLHLCSEAGVVVTAYTDSAKAVMTETADSGGRFESVTLFPAVTVKENSMIAKVNALHAKANERCFIANSVNFPVNHQPACAVEKN
jgi:organic hydroperoxide reductase OsmC/OhrA